MKQDWRYTWRKNTEPTQKTKHVFFFHADVYRTLLYGGIFIYPADKKSPKGKLRILYEGFPMAMLIEQSGGIASTGLFKGKVGRVMDVIPEDIHDRCPIIMGGARDVKIVYDMYKKAGVDVPSI